MSSTHHGIDENVESSVSHRLGWNSIYLVTAISAVTLAVFVAAVSALVISPGNADGLAEFYLRWSAAALAWGILAALGGIFALSLARRKGASFAGQRRAYLSGVVTLPALGVLFVTLLGSTSFWVLVAVAAAIAAHLILVRIAVS